MNPEEEQPQGPFSTFKLMRTTDVTGISGTGVIALGGLTNRAISFGPRLAHMDGIQALEYCAPFTAIG